MEGDYLTVFNSDGTGTREDSLSNDEFLFHWSVEDGVVTQYIDPDRPINSWEYHIEDDILTSIWENGMELSPY